MTAQQFPTFLSTLTFDIILSGNAAKDFDGSDGDTKLPKTSLPKAELPLVVDGAVQNAPPAQDGVLWVVNAMVFQANNNAKAEAKRDDYVAFDPVAAVRGEDGKVISQGGFLYADPSRAPQR